MGALNAPQFFAPILFTDPRSATNASNVTQNSSNERSGPRTMAAAAAALLSVASSASIMSTGIWLMTGTGSSRKKI